MTVVTSATRAAKQAARWQRRLWLGEMVAGPLAVAVLVVAAVALIRRRTRARDLVHAESTNDPDRGRVAGPAAG